MSELSPNVRNNGSRQRYELDAAGMTAIASYEKRGKVVAITHTEVPGEASGQASGQRSSQVRSPTFAPAI